MIVEIRAAEGGLDSKLFVEDLVIAFEKMALKEGWKSQRIFEIDNQINLSINSKKDLKMFAGGHRIQRIPPTEKRGRVHTSTVTVALIDENQTKKININDNDLNIVWFSGTGKGGQHRNKHQNSCKVTHLPTGISESRQGRIRNTNLNEAKNAIEKRVEEYYKNLKDDKVSKNRKKQVGTGMRGDKTFTYRFQDDTVKNHQNGKTMKLKKYLNGNMLDILK